MFSNIKLDLFSVGVAISTSIILGVIVYFRDRRSHTSLFFLLFTVFSSLWSLANYFSYQAFPNETISLWLVRLVMLFAVLQTSAFYFLMKVFPEKNLILSRKRFFLLVSVILIVCVLTLSEYLFSDIKVISGLPPQPVVEPGIAIFAITSISFVMGGIISLIKKIRSAKDEKKTQYRYLAIGVVLMFTLIVIFNFILVSVFSINVFIPVSAIFILPFVVLTFYSIAKYRLLDVKIIGTEIIVLVIVLLTFFEIIFSTSIQELLLRAGVFVVMLAFSIMLIRSVVNEVRQREKLQELTDKLQAIDKQKDEFINMAAHELRAPMTAIKGYISMIMEGDAGEIPEKAREYLTDVNSVNDRLVRLVNNMLNVSRIEEGRLMYKTEVVKLSDVAHNVFISFKFEAQRKGLDFGIHVPDDIRDTVMVDSDRLTEVIGNFVSNAVKYTETGSININISQPNLKTVRLGVKDTGPGISKSEQDKLFQKFYRVQSTAGKTIGTGLGLYISKLLVEKFNGTMGLISEVGKGSEFWFEIPVSDTPLGTVVEVDKDAPIA